MEPWWYTRSMLKKNADLVRGTVLDLGAGHAKYRAIIRQYSASYYTIDAFANSKVDVIGDGMRLPFKKDAFDTIICTSVIEHVPKPWTLLEETHRVLKKEGCLLLSAPWIYLYHGHPQDYYRYSKEGLRSLLSGAGFKDIQISPMGGINVAFVESLSVIMAKGKVQRLLVRVLECILKLTHKGAFLCELNAPNHFATARK